MPEAEAARAIRIALEGLGFEIEANPGSTLLDAAKAAGVAVDSDCGGRGTCGQCRVRFLEGIPRPTQEDELLLASREAKDGWRLACQAVPAGDCRVLIPRRTPRDRRKKIQVLTEAAVAGPPRPGAKRRGMVGYGAAVDVGTTTVVCYLLDLEQSLQIGVESFANPQGAFGADVISRIVYAHRGRRELKQLQRRLLSAVEKALRSLCSREGIATDAVSTITAVGNMTMMHLFRGIDPWPLGVAPYEPVFRESPVLTGEELGFRRFAGCRVQVLPGVGGHMGSDVVAGAMALGLTHRRGMSLFLDLGTNGEVILCSDSMAVGSTSAAGPAFEGVHIHSGMAAFPGAIERVDERDGELELETIGGAEPAGLCGSGLIDVVALLLRRGLLLPSGRLLARGQAPAEAPAALRERLQEDEDGRRFLVHRDGERGDIVLTQRDVREVQLAKAPIRAGIDMLLEETGSGAEAIEGAYVGGAFGSSIDTESLLALGVVPESVCGKVHAVGNTAGLGARLSLTYPEHLREVRQLARGMRHVDLTMREDFREAFAQYLTFPEPRTAD